MSDVVLGWQEKHALVLEHARPYRLLVETGLYQGGGASTTIARLLEDGKIVLYAIDMQRANVDKARAAGVLAFEGDSAVMLPQLLERIDRPACFWLDAHTATEGGDETDSSPLLAELEAILAWPHAAASTVLVDDLRMYGRDGWPRLEEIELVTWPHHFWDWLEQDDILRLTPRV